MPAANAGRPTVLNEDQMERVDTVVAAFANLSSGFHGGVSTQVAQLHKPKRHRLRFVFQDRVASFAVADLRRSRSHAEGAGSQALWRTGQHRLYPIEQVFGNFKSSGASVLIGKYVQSIIR